MVSSTFCGRFDRRYNYTPVVVEDPILTNLKNQMKVQNKFCIEGQLYNQVRGNSMALNYYNKFVCGLNGGDNGKTYISNTYGVRGDRLGSGSFGVVYKYIKDGLEYAIKIPKTYKAFDMFEELNASACIKEKIFDSNILKHLGIIKECVQPKSSDPHLIMNFYPMTLEDKMKKEYSKGWTSSSDFAKMKLLTDMILIAREVEALHNIRIVHRDLKPENIMINMEGEPLLVDFGMASPNFDLAKSVKGTPLFMDYELSKHRGNGQTSDIYALSLIFYSMIYGTGWASKIENMVLTGGYNTAYFSPNFTKLNCPNDLNWLFNMFKPIGTGIGQPNQRWTLENAIDQLTQQLESLKAQNVQVEQPKTYNYQTNDISKNRYVPDNEAKLNLIANNVNRVISDPVTYKYQLEDQKPRVVIKRYVKKTDPIPTKVNVVYGKPKVKVVYGTPKITYKAPVRNQIPFQDLQLKKKSFSQITPYTPLIKPITQIRQPYTNYPPVQNLNYNYTPQVYHPQPIVRQNYNYQNINPNVGLRLRFNQFI